MREFYDAHRTGFRAAAEQNIYQAATIRAQARETRRQARESRIEQARLRNRATQQAKRDRIVTRAGELRHAIAQGTVQWPAALRTGRSKQLVGEIELLLDGERQLSQLDQQRLVAIALELLDTARGKSIGGDSASRVEVVQMATAIKHLGTMENRVLASSR